MLAVARQIGRVSAQRIRAAAREVDLAFRDGSALWARPDRIELLHLGADGTARDAGAFAAAWCAASDHISAPCDPFHTDARPTPGDWATAQPRALERLGRVRAAGRAILALAADLDPPEALRQLFAKATGLPCADMPILTLDTPSDLIPTLVLGPHASATLARDPDRWLPALERRLARTPEMACVVSEGQIFSLRAVIDIMREAGPLPEPEATDPPADDGTPSP